MDKEKATVLTINGGSSSIKFALYATGVALQKTLTGKIDRIGLSNTTLSYHDTSRDQQVKLNIEAKDTDSAANYLLDWLEQQIEFSNVAALGHRVVHGMRHSEPEIISQALLDDLYRIRSYDPDHLPGEIDLIEKFRQRYPRTPQVACFDTAFHHALPRVAKLLPIPRRFDAMGIQRYGFHGLSYTYLMQNLAEVTGPQVARGRVILAHLGNGASLAAVRGGHSMDTSMGFTPTGGVPMGTRSGELDPGVAWYMMQSENLSAEQFKYLTNHESGLLGVSEISSDMRDLISHATHDVRAAEAVDLFCYQVKKCIGAYAAVMNGLDTLVFTGGIGENMPTVRARICRGLDYLGIELDENQNAKNEDIISGKAGRVVVRVMRTDEEQMIAASVCQLLGLSIQEEHTWIRS